MSPTEYTLLEFIVTGRDIRYSKCMFNRTASLVLWYKNKPLAGNAVVVTNSEAGLQLPDSCMQFSRSYENEKYIY